MNLVIVGVFLTQSVLTHLYHILVLLFSISRLHCIWKLCTFQGLSCYDRVQSSQKKSREKGYEWPFGSEVCSPADPEIIPWETAWVFVPFRNPLPFLNTWLNLWTQSVVMSTFISCSAFVHTFHSVELSLKFFALHLDIAVRKEYDYVYHPPFFRKVQVIP